MTYLVRATADSSVLAAILFAFLPFVEPCPPSGPLLSSGVLLITLNPMMFRGFPSSSTVKFAPPSPARDCPLLSRTTTGTSREFTSILKLNSLSFGATANDGGVFHAMLAGAGGAFDDDAWTGDVSLSRRFVVGASTVAEDTTGGGIAGAACG